MHEGPLSSFHKNHTDNTDYQTRVIHVEYYRFILSCQDFVSFKFWSIINSLWNDNCNIHRGRGHTDTYVLYLQLGSTHLVGNGHLSRSMAVKEKSLSIEFFTTRIFVRLSDRSKVTQHKINFVKNCPPPTDKHFLSATFINYGNAWFSICICECCQWKSLFMAINLSPSANGPLN